MKQKTRSKNNNNLIIIVILLSASLLLAMFMFSNVTADPSNSGSDKTELIEDNNDDDNTGDDDDDRTPTPYPTDDPWNPNQSPPPEDDPTTDPTATHKPTSTTKPSTPTSAPRGKINLWQTLYITNVDGSSYWVSPKKLFGLTVFGSDGDNFDVVKRMQNAIYINVPKSAVSPSSVSSYRLTCKETIDIQTESGKHIAYLAEKTSIELNGGKISTDSNVALTSASLNAYELQNVITKATQGYGTYKIVITLSDIELKLNLSNGQQQSYKASSGNSDNVLTWLIKTSHL